MKDLIGIMDSGVGGISVLKKMVQVLPNENFIFFGDNANAPYGPRPVEEIIQLTEAVIDRLLAYDVKAIVIACNTATAAYAEIIRSKISIPVIGIEPAIKPASLVRTNGSILALATRATLSLSKFGRLMERYGEGVIPIEGKGLVEIVESGKANKPEAEAALEELLGGYRDQQIDGIVLGCTHYPFLREKIEKLFPGIPIYDGRLGTAKQLARRLEQAGVLSDSKAPGKVMFETSGGPDKLKLMEELFAAAD